MGSTTYFPGTFVLGSHVTNQGNSVYNGTRLQATRTLAEVVPVNLYHVCSMDCCILVYYGLDDNYCRYAIVYVIEIMARGTELHPPPFLSFLFTSAYLFAIIFLYYFISIFIYCVHIHISIQFYGNTSLHMPTLYSQDQHLQAVVTKRLHGYDRHEHYK